MIEYGIENTKKHTPESLVKELNTRSREGWRVVCTMGRSNEELILVRDGEFVVNDSENEEKK